MKIGNFFKITALMLAVAGGIALTVHAQESRYGFIAYSSSGVNYPAGTLTNLMIFPNDSSVKNVDPTILGAVPTVTFLDANVTVADGGTPNVVVFMTTNESAVFAGANAKTDPRTAITGATNASYYGSNAPGTANAYWLTGVVTGIVTNQFIVVKHQGVSPQQGGFEAAIVQSNQVVYWTNSFTNGANQVTALVTSNSVITLNSGTSAPKLAINSGDQIWFEVTNQVIYVGSNSVFGQRLTMSNPTGVITGQRSKPLMLMFEGSNIVANANVVFQP